MDTWLCVLVVQEMSKQGGVNEGKVFWHGCHVALLHVGVHLHVHASWLVTREL